MATAMPLDPALKVGDLSHVPHDISRFMKGHGCVGIEVEPEAQRVGFKEPFS
jgi:hypothetical protein